MGQTESTSLLNKCSSIADAEAAVETDRGEAKVRESGESSGEAVRNDNRMETERGREKKQQAQSEARRSRRDRRTDGREEDDMVGRHGGPQTSARTPITHSSHSSPSILPSAPGCLSMSQGAEPRGCIPKSTIPFGKNIFVESQLVGNKWQLLSGNW